MEWKGIREAFAVQWDGLTIIIIIILLNIKLIKVFFYIFVCIIIMYIPTTVKNSYL